MRLDPGSDPRRVGLQLNHLRRRGKLERTGAGRWRFAD
jgi:hypothetical protein